MMKLIENRVQKYMMIALAIMCILATEACAQLTTERLTKIAEETQQGIETNLGIIINLDPTNTAQQKIDEAKSVLEDIVGRADLIIASSETLPVRVEEFDGFNNTSKAKLRAIMIGDPSSAKPLSKIDLLLSATIDSLSRGQGTMAQYKEVTGSEALERVKESLKIKSEGYYLGSFALKSEPIQVYSINKKDDPNRIPRKRGKKFRKGKKVTIFETHKKKKISGDGTEVKNTINWKRTPINLLRVDSVNISIIDGKLVEIIAYTESTTFSSVYFSSLTNFENEQYDVLVSNDQTNCPGHFILLGDLLKFIRPAGRRLVPTDMEGTVARSKGELYLPVIQNSSLANLLDIRSYTDLLGVFADEPNAIVAIEGRAQIRTNTAYNLANNWYLGHAIEPYLNFSRFDSDDRFLLIDRSSMPSSDPLVSPDLLALRQRRYLSTGLDIQLVRKYISDRSHITIKSNIGYGKTKLRYDITKDNERDTILRDINLGELGLLATLQVAAGRNFRINATGGIRFQNILGQSGLPDEATTYFEQSGWQGLYELTSEIAYHPMKRKDAELFLRARTVLSDVKRYEPYLLTQIGYRTTLGKLSGD